MTQAQPAASSAPSLKELYALIGPDLARVDELILNRVKEEIPLIHDIARHIIASGGKRIRPALTLICAKLCGYSGARHIALAAAVEFIHTATLLHDDVVDESKLRRNLPTANDVFGNKASVLVGDFLLSQAFQLMVADGSLKTLKILSDASAVIAKGEVMQMMSEGELDTDIEHYLTIIESKTAVLFAAACEVGAVVADAEKHEARLRDFGTHIGIAFQLIDDALDYAGDEQVLGKTVGDDFREGKITLPALLAYRDSSPQEREFWQRTMSEIDQRPEDFATARRLIDTYQSIAQTMDYARAHCHKAHEALSAFPASPAKLALAGLVDFCLSRAY